MKIIIMAVALFSCACAGLEEYGADREHIVSDGRGGFYKYPAKKDK